jgi:hypothetical protein
MTRHAFAAIPVALLMLAACSSSDDSNQQPTGQQFLISGADMSGSNENILVTLNGSTPSNVTVTVNGDTLTNSSGVFTGRLTTSVTQGGAVQLRVTNGTLTAIGNGVVPAPAVITTVTHGALGDPITVNWTAATAPDSFDVYVDYRLADSSTASVTAKIAGSLRSATLPTTSIPANSVVVSAGVDAVVTGTFTGDAAGGSNMRLRTVGSSFAVTIP